MLKTKKRTNLLAAAVLVPLASAGMLGGAVLAEEVGLSATEDDDGDGRGFGLAAGSVHAAVPTPTSNASAATVRTVREWDTYATPRESRLRAANDRHNSCNLLRLRRGGDP